MSKAVNIITKNIFYMYGNTILTVFISLYSTRIILDSLGVSDFGIFTIVGGAIGLLGFFNGSISSATQRFINYAQGENNYTKIREIFNSSVLTHIILSIIIFIILEFAFFIYFNGVLNIPADRIYSAKCIYHIMVISCILGICASPYNACINAHEDMGVLSLWGIVMCIMKFITAVCISLSPIDKLIFYGLCMALIQFSNLCVIYIYCKKKYPECILHLHLYSRKNTIKEICQYASYRLLSTLTSMISVYGGNIIINNFFGTIVNAAQGIANQISGQLMTFSVSLKSAVNPVIGKKAGRKDFTSMIKYALTTSKLSFFLLSCLSVVFFIEMPLILNFWLKEVPEWAIIFCQLELIKNLLYQMLEGPKSAIYSVGKIRSFSICETLIYIIPLPIIYISFLKGAPPTSFYYIIILFFNIVAGVVIVYYSHKNCNMSIRNFLFDIVFRCCFTLIIVFIISSIPHLLLPASYIRLGIVFIVSIISLFITFYYIGLNKSEKEIIINLLLRFKSFISQKLAKHE